MKSFDYWAGPVLLLALLAGYWWLDLFVLDLAEKYGGYALGWSATFWIGIILVVITIRRLRDIARSRSALRDSKTDTPKEPQPANLDHPPQR